MSSIQAYKAHKQEGTLVNKVHKQVALSTLPKHPYISGCAGCLTTKLFFSIFCNLELISVSYNYDAATDVGMLGKMCRVPLVCAPCLPMFLLVCVLCRPVCWTSLHLISFYWPRSRNIKNTLARTHKHIVFLHID